MSLLKKLLGGNETPAVKPPSAGAAKAPAGTDVVKVFDQFGRQVQIPRERWRTQVLLPPLASKRSDPNALYDLESPAEFRDLNHEVPSSSSISSVSNSNTWSS